MSMLHWIGVALVEKKKVFSTSTEPSAKLTLCIVTLTVVKTLISSPLARQCCRICTIPGLVLFMNCSDVMHCSDGVMHALRKTSFIAVSAGFREQLKHSKSSHIARPLGRLSG